LRIEGLIMKLDILRIRDNIINLGKCRVFICKCEGGRRVGRGRGMGGEGGMDGG
jgi:hypothetical protein